MQSYLNTIVLQHTDDVVTRILRAAVYVKDSMHSEFYCLIQCLYAEFGLHAVTESPGKDPAAV